MSATFFGEWELPDYRGGASRWTLEIAENDGRIVIGLSPAEGDELRQGLLEPEEAEQVAKALSDAILRVKGKGA